MESAQNALKKLAYYDMLEQICALSKNINQSEAKVLWTMAGSIDKLLNTYGSRFFSEIKVLALTSTPEMSALNDLSVPMRHRRKYSGG